MTARVYSIALLAGCGAIAIGLPLTAASAQAASPAIAPHDRVGPEATPPLLPAYASSPPAAPATALPLAAPAASGSLVVRDVYVGSDPGVSPAHALAGWVPPAPDSSGLKLVHDAGEALDGGWVRRQFAANGMIGAETGYDRIGALIQLINLAYVRNGYINSGVVALPQPAGAADGLLRLKLVTGHLVAPAGGEPVTVVWKNGHAKGLTADYVRNRMAAAGADPLSITGVERDFRLLADDPAIRTINADLRPGDRPGEASLLLTVDPGQRLDFYEGFANSRSPSVGGERVSFGGSLRNTLAAGDIVSAEVGSTKGLTDFVAGYTTPFATPGLSFQVDGGFDNAAVIDRPLVPLDIKSREWSIEGGFDGTVLARPLTPLDSAGHWDPAQNLVLGVLVAHHHLTSELLGIPFSFSPGADNGLTEYSAARFTADYTRRSIRSVLAFSFTGSVGLDGTRPDDPTVPRPSQHFRAALVQLNYAYRLNPHQLELRLRFAGQSSSGLLYSPERFALGGIDTVRGYRENLLLADEAAVGSIEFAQPLSLNDHPSADGIDWTAFTLSVFADGGWAHNRAAPQPAPKTIESLGFGATWTPAPWLTARASYARALNHVDAPGRRDLQDRGFEFRIVLRPLPLFFPPHG